MSAWNHFCRLAAIGGLVATATAGTADARTVVIQKTTVYVTTLPKGCVKTSYSGGVVVWKCGKLYYQPYQNRYVRVYIK